VRRTRHSVRAWARGLAVAATTTAAPGIGLAQNVSDLQPAPPRPTGQETIINYQPGMPAPRVIQRDLTEAKEARTAGARTPAGAAPQRVGRFIYDVGGLGAQDEGAVSSSETPELYVVKKGDTLWAISSQFFRDPFAWPKLWAMNPAITNPHWIYPGDVIRLAPGAGEQPVATPPTPEPDSKRPAPGVASRGLFLRQNGFVEPEELESAGDLIGSKEEKIMLGTLDEAYVAFKAKAPMRAGEKYSVYKPIKTVKHPVTGKRLGEIVQIFGEVEIRSVTDGKIAKAAIIDSTDPIERGYKVGPLKRQFKIVDPVTNATDQVGVVVDTLRPIQLIGTETLIFLDKGKRDGVQVGNRFLVVRRGDGYQPLLATGPVDDKRFPRETIAEALVIDLRNDIATALVTKATKEARVGDRVEARRGY
jgi:hypothetical protein